MKSVRRNIVIRLGTLFVIAVAFFALPQLWHWNGLPALIFGGLAVMTFFLVRWHARNTGYECPECRHLFMVSPVTDFLSPHLGGVKLLRCPQCGRSSWCPEIDAPSGLTASSRKNYVPLQAPDRGTSLRIQIVVVVVIYISLWAYTLFAWPALPENTSSWTILKIPVIIAVLPALQMVFCFFALRHGYRSRLYLAVSLFVIVFLLLAVWMQRAIIADLIG